MRVHEPRRAHAGGPDQRGETREHSRELSHGRRGRVPQTALPRDRAHGVRGDRHADDRDGGRMRFEIETHEREHGAGVDERMRECHAPLMVLSRREPKVDVQHVGGEVPGSQARAEALEHRRERRGERIEPSISHSSPCAS